MVKRKGVSLLKKEKLQARHPSLHKKVKSKAPKPVPAAKPKPAADQPQARHTPAAGAAAKRKPAKVEPKTQDEWVPHSAVVRHAAEALAKLLAADESRSGGKTIKSLTLAPHIKEKKATFALTCQTLRCEPASFSNEDCWTLPASQPVSMSAVQRPCTKQMCATLTTAVLGNADLPVLQKVVDQTQLLGRHPRVLSAACLLRQSSFLRAVSHSRSKQPFKPCSCSSRRRWRM